MHGKEVLGLGRQKERAGLLQEYNVSVKEVGVC